MYKIKRFNKARFIRNIKFLLKKNNIKMKELEEKAGCSSGYLARLDKNENAPHPGIDFVFAACELFEIGLDTLTQFDFDTTSEDDRLTITFLNSVLSEIYADFEIYSKKDGANKFEFIKSKCYDSKYTLSDKDKSLPPKKINYQDTYTEIDLKDSALLIFEKYETTIHTNPLTNVSEECLEKSWYEGYIIAPDFDKSSETAPLAFTTLNNIGLEGVAGEIVEASIYRTTKRTLDAEVKDKMLKYISKTGVN